MSTQYRTWFVGLALVGAVAGTAAIALLWLVVTEPLAVARVLSGGL